jgi:hypothetical protein
MRRITIFVLLLAAALTIAWGIFGPRQQYDLVNGDPAPGPTNGERWARMCRVEAGPSKRDQDDCVYKHALSFSFQKFNADYERRLRDDAR